MRVSRVDLGARFLVSPHSRVNVFLMRVNALFDGRRYKGSADTFVQLFPRRVAGLIAMSNRIPDNEIHRSAHLWEKGRQNTMNVQQTVPGMRGSEACMEARSSPQRTANVCSLQKPVREAQSLSENCTSATVRRFIVLPSAFFAIIQMRKTRRSDLFSTLSQTSTDFVETRPFRPGSPGLRLTKR